MNNLTANKFDYLMNENFTKAMTIKELAALYHVSNSTFKRWLEPFKKRIGRKEGWFYKPRQVRRIFELLGEPW